MNDYIHDNKEDNNTILFIDPPYYDIGKSLYMKYFDNNDHHELAKILFIAELDIFIVPTTFLVF